MLGEGVALGRHDRVAFQGLGRDLRLCAVGWGGSKDYGCRLSVLNQKNIVGPPRPYWVYLLECQDGSFYAGIAIDVAARFRKHISGGGAKYTRARPPVKVLASRPYGSKGDALRAEIQLKRLPKKLKLGFFKLI